MIRQLSLTLALFFCVGIGSAARAQGPRIVYGAPVYVQSSAPAAISPVPVYPYSYYAAVWGNAREYVPYNSGDAWPYYGQPYGHTYDRWSWATLSGSNASPARYFYPPVR